jgi:hypothetical protein
MRRKAHPVTAAATCPKTTKHNETIRDTCFKSNDDASNGGPRLDVREEKKGLNVG